MTGFQSNWKPSRTARKKAEKKRKQERIDHEVDAKKETRKRDGFHCRFPLCGCKRLGLQLEVSHARHKGMGGNPAGDRSTTAGLMLLCSHRHQFGSVSIHRGTLNPEPLDATLGLDGPVRWLVDMGAGWVEVAKETSVQYLEPLTPLQQSLLVQLAIMDL